MFKSLILALGVVVSAWAHAGVPDYYHKLADKTAVPTEVLFALAITETNTPLDNGKSMPWPYTLNLNGIPEYFLTFDQMISRAKQLLSNQIIHFDCGLFQVNWKWNGRVRSPSVTDACSPYRNGEIASDIMKEWYAKTGDWVEAAGYYHNPANHDGAADIYKKKFDKNLRFAKRALHEY
ncbi:transglycosylase SLT domain-containing protein [Vibrio sp. Y2-5]|uniref:transglycosylase SLT domain-containing protein n=1 Tax=Vibrio sp. Y2-5 TaxID=2743977 RepID=UPI0016611CFD|nr:transglycosylase SLT domain-containing protein [Vibrio sp. Y2-5]MBD0788054.1 transglycosylase SLT domain-containing protein [Vibrio sp. Y2-5]